MSNLVFELERLEGVTVEGAMSAFREWVEDHPARKKGAWGEPLRSVTLQDLALHNLGIQVTASTCSTEPWASPRPRFMWAKARAAPSWSGSLPILRAAPNAGLIP